MKIIDILNKKKPSVSFEVFPPKENSKLADVMNTVERLSRQKPDFISVTYGAGGELVPTHAKLPTIFKAGLALLPCAFNMRIVHFKRNQENNG